jgi:hypothetical protein
MRAYFKITLTNYIFVATIIYVSIKNKKISNTQKLRNLGTQASVILMAAATTVGVMDMQQHQNVKVVIPNQPTFAFETDNTDLNNPILREREESAPHYISYDVAQRTPSRHGKR